MEASDYFDRLVSRSIPVIIDDEGAAPALSALGFRIERFDDRDFTDPNGEPALVVITRVSSIEKLHALWGQAATLFCHLSLAKFESSPKSLAYSIGHLLSLDHRAALERRTESYDRLLSCQSVEVETAGGVLRFHVGDEIEVANCGTLIEPGQLYSAGEFFEASIVNLEGERSSFWVEGEIEFDAFIHLSNDAELKERHGPALDDLVRRAASGGNALRFVDNRLERVVVGGSDVTATFLEMTEGKERGGAATEFGLGCADLREAEDRTINAVLHKARRGAYVGIGKGLHIPHIDFIAKAAEVRFIGAS